MKGYPLKGYPLNHKNRAQLGIPIFPPRVKLDPCINLHELRDRREKLCEHFFEKNIDNENLKDLLPQTILSGYDLRPI